MTTRSPIRSNAALATMAIALLCQPASALDFSPLPRVFLENFVGETSSPTSPEIDLLGTDGVVVDGGLMGGVAELSIVDIGTQVDVATYQLTAIERIFTDGPRVGARAEFDNLVIQSDGSVALATGLSFAPILAGLDVQVSAGLILTQSAGGNSGTLALAEVDFVNPDQLATFGLSQSAVDAILQGAAVRLELLVDESTTTAVTEVFVDGVSAQMITLDLLALEEHTLDNAFAVLAFEPPIIPSAASVDLVRLETYAQPLALTPFVNIDFAGGAGTPSSTFAGAGGAGVWNYISISSAVALNDAAGNPSGASITSDLNGYLEFGSGYVSDIGALLFDYAGACDPSDSWQLDVAGLTDGIYRALIYAPSNATYNSGDISMGGIAAIANLTGSPTSDLIEGVSWGSALAVVQGGVLTISGEGTGNVQCTGLAGMQIDQAQPVAISQPVPSLGHPALMGLASLLMLLGGRRRK